MQYTVRCDMCSLLKGGQININFYRMEKSVGEVYTKLNSVQ